MGHSFAAVGGNEFIISLSKLKLVAEVFLCACMKQHKVVKLRFIYYYNIGSWTLRALSWVKNHVLLENKT